MRSLFVTDLQTSVSLWNSLCRIEGNFTALLSTRASGYLQIKYKWSDIIGRRYWRDWWTDYGIVFTYSRPNDAGKWCSALNSFHLKVSSRVSLHRKASIQFKYAALGHSKLLIPWFIHHCRWKNSHWWKINQTEFEKLYDWNEDILQFLRTKILLSKFDQNIVTLDLLWTL